MKFSIALNSTHPLAVQLNALGHVCVGLAHLAPHGTQALRTFAAANGAPVGMMTDHPLIVLSARSSRHLMEAHRSALNQNLAANVFTIDMKDGAPEEQEHRIRTKLQDDLDYVAVGFYGDNDALRGLTKKFSLFRG